MPFIPIRAKWLPTATSNFPRTKLHHFATTLLGRGTRQGGAGIAATSNQHPNTGKIQSIPLHQANTGRPPGVGEASATGR